MPVSRIAALVLVLAALAACGGGDDAPAGATAVPLPSPTVDPAGGPRVSARPILSPSPARLPARAAVVAGRISTPVAAGTDPAVAYLTAVADMVSTQAAMVATINAGGWPTATPARSSGGSSSSSSATRNYPRDVWQGAYFNNQKASGAPVTTRRDSAIDFDWGNGAPAAGVNADNFSARWQRSFVGVNGGVFRFRAVTDDGIRIKLDGKLILNEFTGGAKDVSVDVGLTPRDHQVQVDYFDQTGTARARVWVERTHNPVFPDWRAEYYNNITLAGDAVLVRNEVSPRINWGTKGPDSIFNPEMFSARFQKTEDFERGEYEFSVRSDDGVRLWVGDELIIDRWHASDGKATFTAKRRMSGNDERVKIEYFNGHNKAMLNATWKLVSESSGGGGGGSSRTTSTPLTPPTTGPTPTTAAPAPTYTPGSQPPTFTPPPGPSSTAPPVPTETETVAPTTTAPGPTNTPGAPARRSPHRPG